MSKQLYIQCQNCGHKEKIDKGFFLKVLGGAVGSFGVFGWVTFLFAGTGLAMPICIAIVSGGAALLAFGEEIAEWVSTKYDCPSCGSRNWTTVTNDEVYLKRENSLRKANNSLLKKNNALLQKSNDALQSENADLKNYIAQAIDEGSGIETLKKDNAVSALHQLYKDANQYIHLMYPWYNHNSVEQDLPLLKQAIDRGVEIYIYYGIGEKLSSHDDKKRARKTINAVDYLEQECDSPLIHSIAVNSHQKIAICDRYALFGSHNLMSNRSNEWSWEETTVKFSGPAMVETFKKVIDTTERNPHFRERAFDE